MFEIPLSDLVLEKLQRQSEIPLQRQLYQIIHEAINAGKLATDCKLPSSRYLSKEVDISRITVSLVYERLVSEGYLYSKKGSGTYVSKLITPLKPPPNLSEPSPWVYSERGAKLLRNESSPPQPYGEFVPGIADIEAFPFYLWRKILAKYYSKKYYDLSSYAESGGYIELRRAIASYLSVSRSLHCDPDQVIVTFGTPQSLDLCARMLSDPGEEAYIEDPAHWATQSIFEAAGLNIRSIPLDEEGIHLQDDMVSPKGKFVYVTPSHQYPTGVVMSAERRAQILRIAKARNLWLIEDDYDAEFRYEQLHLPTLQSMDRDNRVIYFGTFSKTMFSGIRLSYMVVPHTLTHALRRAISNLYLPGMLHLQAAMAEFINEGHFYRHIKKMRTIYLERGQIFRAKLQEVFGDKVQLSPGKSGMHLLAIFDSPLSYEQFTAHAKHYNIVVRQPHYRSVSPSGLQLVLGFGGVQTAQIPAGVLRLQQVMQEAERALFDWQ